ncbi:apoptosis-associated speck-like protein containing a CARD [Echinops telfairi]|uniref:Apoptosis-associated speck-like protein containing a CARD n=1 Tax=Echinops telfairi TaxID=9371 RepID=A0AC55CPB7_ECHTE|nr:apoptosis-associated speck-like protein containing a CARD [Echinops telfairi]
MGDVREAILEALENLTPEELKKFKQKLLWVQLPEGCGRLPRGTLQSMDALDLTDKLVCFYLEDPAAQLTATVLRDMGMQQTAERLQRTLRRGPGAQPAAPADWGQLRSPGGPCGAGELTRALSSLAPAGPHFVDRHRAALISRVTAVGPVLDALYAHALTDEQYEEVRAEATNPARMRKLFSFAPAWNLTCKDRLLQALRDTQPYLVEELERS